MSDAWLWLGLFILLAYTLEAITGFGSTIVALSLGALLLPIRDLLPVLVPLNILMSSVLAWRNRQLVQWRLLLATVLPGMLIGTSIGYGLRPWLDDGPMKLGFGLLILWFALRELLRGAPRGHRPTWMTRLQTGAAGISHGLFASGGPLLVHALAGTALDKARLRATLLCVWFGLNSLLTLAYLYDGSLVPALPRIATYAPLLLVGVLAGEYLHQRLAERHFRTAVHLLLCLCGVLLCWRA
ncbi:sulfite exporter TauE/SafE family protein [Pseudomonas resinovorans]|uniref:Probable membrane transporter protein n=1 Tax=Metapseudomonas resinovorans TaxID=53412 RepID=A0ABT4Y718_METRE|nr:sulfite exporter TauE/SafE family protein [Pseudomonas resinovorans]MDA8484665.1 sulfite exporter TauE/SafE family protein [Pseudomonas resinovorans]